MTDGAFFQRSYDSDTVPAITGAFPRVACVVVAADRPGAAADTLASLRRARYGSLRTVLVGRGAPTDEPPAILGDFPEVTLVQATPREGRVAALNLGIRHALASRCDYVLLLSDDAEIDPTMVAELVDAAESSPGIGCAGPKLLCQWDRERLFSAGAAADFRRSAAGERGAGEVDRGQFDQPVDLDCLSGCGLLIRRSVLEQVGLFDPLYLAERVDADWCLRSTRRGFRCRYVPRARLWRRSPLGDGMAPAVRGYGRGRDWAVFVRRYGRGLDWVRFWLGLAESLPGTYLSSVLAGSGENARSAWRGVLDGLVAPIGPPPGIGRRGP